MFIFFEQTRLARARARLRIVARATVGGGGGDTHRATPGSTRSRVRT